MLTYMLDRRGKLPVYDYLYRCIRKDILSGTLKAGERLPSKRELAQQLGVSVVTVTNAYAQLSAEGFLRTEERRGYFVNPVEHVEPKRAKKPAENEEKQDGSRFYLMDFKTNEVEGERFPFSVWSRLMRRVLSERQEELLKATGAKGIWPLRKAISDYLYRSRGMEAGPEQIVVGAGTEYLYNLIAQLLGKEKVYGVEDPGYRKVAQVYGVNGLSVRYIGMDGQGVSPEELRETDTDVMHLSPSHHFPTGVVTPVGRRQALLRWAEEKKSRFLLEDDYDSEFRFTGRPIPTLQSMDRTGKVLYVNTFSKTLAPSFRISYLVLPETLLPEYEERLGFYACTVPSLEQYTLAAMIEEGHLERHIGRMKTFYREKRDKVIEAIRQSPLGEKVRILEADAGLHFLLELPTVRSDEELRQAAAEEGIRLSFLSAYVHGAHRAEEHRMVINYSGIDLKKLPECLEKLAALL